MGDKEIVSDPKEGHGWVRPVLTTILVAAGTAEVASCQDQATAIEQSFDTALSEWSGAQFHTEASPPRLGTDYSLDTNSLRYPVNQDGTPAYLEQVNILNPSLEPVANVTFGTVNAIAKNGDVIALPFLFDLNPEGFAGEAYYLRYDENASTDQVREYGVVDSSWNVVAILTMPTTLPDADAPFAQIARGNGTFNLMSPQSGQAPTESQAYKFITQILQKDASPALAMGPATAVPVTETPRPADTATPTKDPMKDAPTGATGFENGKYYMVGENGDKYFYDKTREQFYWENKADGYTYFYFPKSGEQEAYLARPLIENYYAYDRYDSNTIPMDIYVKLGTPGSEKIVRMNHSDGTDFYDKIEVTNEITAHLVERFNFSSPPEMIAQLESEEGIQVKYTVNGDPQIGRFSRDSGVQVTIVDALELKELVDQKKALAVQGTLGMIYFTIDGVKEDGTIMFRVAHEKSLDKLLVSEKGYREYSLRFLIWLPIANLFNGDRDQLDVYNLSLASRFASGSGFLRKDGNPDLDIVVKP